MCRNITFRHIVYFTYNSIVFELEFIKHFLFYLKLQLSHSFVFIGGFNRDIGII